MEQCQSIERTPSLEGEMNKHKAKTEQSHRAGNFLKMNHEGIWALCDITRFTTVCFEKSKELSD